MQHIINTCIAFYLEFEQWFEKKLGWFFTNGFRSNVSTESEG